MSSLAYLKNLEINTIKLDGSYVRDVLTNPRSQALVRAIVQLADAMGITTVAEYVESNGVRDRLAALGIQFGQGLCARPSRARSMTCWPRWRIARPKVASVRSPSRKTYTTPSGIPIMFKHAYEWGHSSFPSKRGRTSAPSELSNQPLIARRVPFC